MQPFERPAIPLRLVLIIGLLFAGITIAGFVYYGEQKSGIQRQQNGELNAIADLKVKQIETWRSERLADGREIRENPLLRQPIARLLKGPSTPQLEQTVRQWMSEYKNRHPYSSLVLLDDKRAVRLSTFTNTPSMDAESMRIAAAAMRNPQVILFDFHRSATGAINLDLCVPISFEDRSPTLGVVLIEIDPARFLYPTIQSWPTPSKTAETLLLRREGGGVLFLNELRHRQGTALAFRRPIEGTVLHDVKPGPDSIGESHDYRGVPVIGAVREVAGTSWILIAKIDREDIYGSLRQRAVSTALLGVFLFMAFAAGILLLWREQQAGADRRQAEAAREQQELRQRLDVISRYANDIILLADATGKILDANERAILSYGYDRRELLRLTMSEMLLPEARMNFESQWARLMEEGTLVTEAEHHRKDGSSFPVEISARLVSFDGNMCCQSIIRDISERRKAEEQLRLLESVSMQTSDGILILRTSGDDACTQQAVFLNPAFEQITGYNLDDITEGAIHRLFPKAANPHAITCRGLGFRERCPKHLEQLVLRKDGSKFWAEWRFKPLAVTGSYSHCVWICRDITSRKRAEESAEFLGSIVEFSNDAIIGKDMDGTVLSWNNAAERIYGYSAEEMVGRNVAILVPPEHLNEWSEMLGYLSRGQNIENLETERIRKDGGRILVSLTVSPIKDSLKNVVGVSVISRDITERKRAAEQLIEAHRKTTTILENILDGFVTFDRDWRHIYVNAAAAKILGKAPEDLWGKTVWAAWPFAADSTFGQAFQRAIDQNISVHVEAFVPDPINKWLEARCYPTPEGLALFFNDVTGRKQATSALKLSEERYRSLALVTSHIVWTTNADGSVDDMPLWREFTGQTLEQVKGRGWIEALHPDDRERTASIWSQAVKARSFYVTEYRMRRHDGEYRWMSVHGVPVLNEDGNVREWVGTCADITETKQAGEAVRESQADLNRAQAVAHVGSWRSDLQKNELTWSDEAYRIFGIPKGTHITFDMFINAVHPDDRKLVDRSAAAAIEGEPYDVEHRIFVGNAVKWVHERGELDASGGFGTVQDITDRKRAEQALRLHSEMLQQTHELIFTFEIDGGIQYWNPAAESFYGYKRAEALGRVSYDLLHTVHPLGMKQILALVARDGTWKGELTQTTKDGRKVVVECIMTLFRDADGRRLVLESNHDVTERKHAEAQVHALNAELEQRVAERTAQLVASNNELEAFAYSVSHDLRAPLRAVDGFSRILLEEFGPQLPSEAQHYLQVARNNAVQMGELIDGLLKFSRLGRQPLCKQPLDPADLVRQVWSDLRFEQDGRQVDLTINAMPRCEGDALLLKQVFANLISNALKYTRTREVAKIEVGSTDAPAYYVRDNGVGFDMRYRDKLFGVFQRLHRAEDYEGTGVGLATVQRIIHRHGGEVWAEAALNIGATFYFTLAQAADAAERNGNHGG